MLKVLSRKIGIFLLLWPLVYYFLSLCIAVKNNRQQEMKCMEDLRRVAISKDDACLQWRERECWHARPATESALGSYLHKEKSFFLFFFFTWTEVHTVPVHVS